MRMRWQLRTFFLPQSYWTLFIVFHSVLNNCQQLRTKALRVHRLAFPKLNSEFSIRCAVSSRCNHFPDPMYGYNSQVPNFDTGVQLRKSIHFYFVFICYAQKESHVEWNRTIRKKISIHLKRKEQKTKQMYAYAKQKNKKVYVWSNRSPSKFYVHVVVYVVSLDSQQLRSQLFEAHMIDQLHMTAKACTWWWWPTQKCTMFYSYHQNRWCPTHGIDRMWANLWPQQC